MAQINKLMPDKVAFQKYGAEYKDCIITWKATGYNKRVISNLLNNSLNEDVIRIYRNLCFYTEVYNVEVCREGLKVNICPSNMSFIKHLLKVIEFKYRG